MDKKVSIIMSTYKEKKEWVKLSIESILAQTYQNFEFFIIIDDPDNVELKNIIYGYALKDQRVKIWENTQNKGLVFCLNKGLEMATGAFVARMDADDISESSRIEEELDYLEKYDLDLVGSDIIAINEDSEILPNVATQAPISNKCIINLIRYKSCLMHPTWLGKKELFEDLSGYREINYCEDYDFLLRAISFGAKLGNVPKPLLKYRYNFGGISRQNKAEQRCISCFLSKIRKNINEINVETINSYATSKKGQKELEKWDRYFAISKIALKNIINREYIDFIKNIFNILCMTYGRKSAYIIFISKILVKIDRRGK